MTNTNADIATVLETPELVDVLKMAAYALELAISEGIIAADAPHATKVALAHQAFLTIGLDRIMYHPDFSVREAIVQGIGKLVYRDVVAA